MDWGSLAQAIGGSVDSLITNLFNFGSSHKTNKSNERNVQATNQMNYKIATDQLEAQMSQHKYDQVFEREEAEKAYQRELEKMQMEQAYNSPIQQLQRFQEAGVNPSVAFAGNLSNAMTSSGSAPQAHSPSNAISPSMPNMVPFQAQPFRADPLLGAESVSRIVKAFAEAKKAGAEAHEVSTLLSSNLEKLNSEVEGQKLSNFIQSNFGEKREAAMIAYYSQQVVTLASQGKLDDARAAVAETEKYLNGQLARYHGENADLLKKRNDTYMVELRSALDTSSAQAEAYRAQASESRTKANYNVQETLRSEELTKQAVYSAMAALEDYYGKQLDNKQKHDVYPLLRENVLQSLRQAKQDYWNPFHYVGSLLGGSAAAGIKAVFEK